MKTTIELADELLTRVKAVAGREGTTLKSMVEEGLQLVLQARERAQAKPLRVKPFRGDGLSDAFRGAGWDRVRDEIYDGRG